MAVMGRVAARWMTVRPAEADEATTADLPAAPRGPAAHARAASGSARRPMRAKIREGRRDGGIVPLLCRFVPLQATVAGVLAPSSFALLLSAGALLAADPAIPI